MKCCVVACCVWCWCRSGWRIRCHPREICLPKHRNPKHETRRCGSPLHPGDFGNPSFGVLISCVFESGSGFFAYLFLLPDVVGVLPLISHLLHFGFVILGFLLVARHLFQHPGYNGFMGWLIGWLVDWLIGWLVGSLIVWLSGRWNLDSLASFSYH